MRRASVGVFALALVVAAPAAAKGPSWVPTTLEKPRAFGSFVFAAGEAAVYRSGGPAFGRLEKPFPLSARVTLPKGTIVSFAETTSEPPYRLRGAAVPGPFSACGIEFLPSTEAYLELTLRGPLVPKGYTPLELRGFLPLELEEHHFPGALGGRIRHPMELGGLSLPAGSKLFFECEGPAPVIGGWSGEFERDTEVGGLLLRGHMPSDVSFGMLGPYVVSGTLARPGEVHDRALPAGTRVSGYLNYLTAGCPDWSTAVFMHETWIGTCGTPVAAESPTANSGTHGTASLRPRRARAAIPWTLVALGVAALFASTALSLILIWRRAPGRA